MALNNFAFRDSTPGPAVLIEQLVNQASSAAPTVTASLTDNSGKTLTWARTSAGIYTLTASAALFTAGKTFVNFSFGGTARTGTYVVTSNTVLTFTFQDAATPSAADLAGDMSLRIEVWS